MAVCLGSLCGCLGSNYVQLCTRKTLPGHCSPCHITVLSGISSLPRGKHRWHIGIDVFMTKWAMNILAWPLARVNIPEREKCMSPFSNLCKAFLFSPLSLSVRQPKIQIEKLGVLLIHEKSSSKSISHVPAWHQVLIVKVIGCYILWLHRETSKWTYGQRLRLWKSLQLFNFLIEAINSLSAWHFIATFSAG